MSLRGRASVFDGRGNLGFRNAQIVSLNTNNFVLTFKSVYNILMKKFVVCILISLTLLNFASPVVLSKTPGEALKNMGYVVGFKDGNLYEEKIMTQGELVAMVARYIEKNFIPRRYTVVSEKNGFDKAINSVYNFLITSFYKVKIFLMKEYYSIFNKEIYPNIGKDSYLFKEAVVLNAYGYNIPDGVDFNAKLTSETFFDICYSMLGFDEGEFYVNGIIPSEQMRILNTVHGQSGSSLLNNGEYLKRSEVFSEFLKYLSD